MQTTYTFERGFPTDETTQRARGDQDFERAVTAYRFWYPTVSMEGVFNGNRELGARDNERMMIMACQPRHVVFTGNSDTPYGAGILDLKDGPIVVELPPGPFIALADDHHQRWVLDMGLPGPDAGKGGKHVLLPPGFAGTPPAGHHAGRSASFKVVLAIRAMPVKGDLKGALESLRTIKVYPLATAGAPRLLGYVDVTEKAMDSTLLRWEDNLTYWEKLHAVIDAEPVVDEFRPMYGVLASLGIEKGKPFAPDTQRKQTLTRAARAGRDQMLVSAFAGARPERMVWSDRRWEWVGLPAEGSDFETPAGLDVEARDRWFAQAIAMSPAMFRRQVGFGSLYWLGHRDTTGAFLDGGKTYRLNLPQPVPASLFWSVTVYDAATRSQIQTSQDRAAIRSLFEKMAPNPDRSVDLYFGPQAPAGEEGQWIKTTPGRGWFSYFRIYGPEAAAFDGSWKPGDFEAV
jgi:hypothetical protein